MKKLNLSEIKLPKFKKEDKPKVIRTKCMYPNCNKDVYKSGAKLCLEHKREMTDVAGFGLTALGTVGAAASAYVGKKIIKK